MITDANIVVKILYNVRSRGQVFKLHLKTSRKKASLISDSIYQTHKNQFIFIFSSHGFLNEQCSDHKSGLFIRLKENNSHCISLQDFDGIDQNLYKKRLFLI